MDEKINGENGKSFNLLQAAKWYWPEVGGIETVALRITEAVKDNAEVNVLVCSEKKKREVQTDEDGVCVYRAKTPLTLFSTPLSFDYIRTFRRMAKDADIIQLHAPFPLSDLAYFLSSGKCKKAKKVLWWHSDVVKQKKLMLFYKPLMKWVLKHVDKIYVASMRIAEQSAYLGDYMDKVEVIPFGISIGDYDSAERYPILTDKLTDKNNAKILFVGRLVYYKGIDVLIEAMAKTSGAELFVIGGGELDEMLKKRVAELGIEDKIHFLGRVDDKDLLAAFSDSDVFVLPSVSRAECFGIVQMEAMVYGKPVINTSLETAVPEVSLHGETGLTVTPGDIDELAEAINKLASDKELRESYGTNARKRCLELYDVERMKKSIYDSYVKLLAENENAESEAEDAQNKSAEQTDENSGNDAKDAENADVSEEVGTSANES